ncbi:hypothetical protein JW935_15500 [candidate division KSB1 bacterium]|nr:hypothetical protein [candidate division KSB1 bacterium]
MLVKEKQSQIFHAAVKVKKHMQHYSCSMSVCDNPSCTCNDIGLNFSPLAVEKKPSSETSVLYFEINLKKKRLLSSWRKNATSKEIDFARTVMDQMNADDFDLLHKEFIEYKRQISETVDLKTVQFMYDVENIQRSGKMLFYSDIFPYIPEFTVNISGIEYVVVDDYCVMSDCDCTTVG